MKEYQCDVVITWSGNSMEAESLEDYKTKVRDLYYEEHNIKDMREAEITNIKEI